MPKEREAAKVFISYSRKDTAFVTDLHQRLTRDGVSCFLDTESIDWGENWVRALQRALDDSEHVVFVLTPDFCESVWAGAELDSTLAADMGRLAQKVRPLRLIACDHLPTFPRFLKPVQTVDVSNKAAFEANYERICRGLGGEPQPDLTATSRASLPPVQPLPEPYRMPFASLGERFIGRVEAIWELHRSLMNDRTSVLQGTSVVAGTGGLGKTQLAIEYAHRFGSQYPVGVYWVQADLGIVAVVTQISEAAGIAIDTKVDEKQQTAQLWRELNSRRRPYLVILDNFPEDVKLQPYLPTTGSVHTVITTRRQDLNLGTVRLGTLSVEDGARLLNSGARPFGAAAEKLAQRLGGLPLALELCKSYLNYSRNLSVDAVMEEMDRAGEIDLLATFAQEYRDELPSRHEADVAQTFQLSWNIAPDGAKQVLRVLGELAAAPVPRRFLYRVLGFVEGGFRDEVSKGLDELGRLSLIEFEENGSPVAHRLIGAFVRHRNAADGEEAIGAKCVKAVLDEMEKAFADPDAGVMQDLEGLLPHAEYLAEKAVVEGEDRSDLLNRIGAHLQVMGRYTASGHAFRRALEWAENTYAAGHPRIATIQSNLAQVLQDLGKLTEARDLLRAALESEEKTFALGHPRVAVSQSNLGLVLKDLGELAEARDLLRTALQTNEKTYAAGHPIVAVSQSNLGQVLQDLGELAESRDLLRTALESDEKTFASGHPRMAVRQSNLGVVLRGLGELADSRDLLRAALKTNEKTYAEGHPSIAVSQSNLALVLKDLGEFAEARDLLRAALESDEKTFAAGHPRIAVSQSNLAVVLKDLEELDEARDLVRKAYRTMLDRFGSEHPNSKIVKRNLDAIAGEAAAGS